MGRVRVHVDANDTRVAKEIEVLDCYHEVKKGDVFYIAYDFDQPVLAICKDCAIVDR